MPRGKHKPWHFPREMPCLSWQLYITFMVFHMIISSLLFTSITTKAKQCKRERPLEQEQTQDHATEEECWNSTQRSLSLHLLSSQVGAVNTPSRQVVRIGIVQSGLWIPKHPRKHRNSCSTKGPWHWLEEPRRPATKTHCWWGHVVIVMVWLILIFESLQLLLRMLRLRWCLNCVRLIGRWPLWDFQMRSRGAFGNMIGSWGSVTSTIKRDNGGLREVCLADRTLLGTRILVIYPLVNAWPAIKVATERDNGVLSVIQADVAIEAAGGVVRWGRCAGCQVL